MFKNRAAVSTILWTGKCGETLKLHDLFHLNLMIIVFFNGFVVNIAFPLLTIYKKRLRLFKLGRSRYLSRLYNYYDFFRYGYYLPIYFVNFKQIIT